MNAPNATLTTPETIASPRLNDVNFFPVYAKGAPIAIVMTIIPAIVPTPNTSRYVTAQRGSRIVVSTSRATAAEPASPCTIPNGQRPKHLVQTDLLQRLRPAPLRRLFQVQVNFRSMRMDVLVTLRLHVDADGNAQPRRACVRE